MNHIDLSQLSESRKRRLLLSFSERELTQLYIDEYGVVYSSDKKRLIDAPVDIVKYSIIEGTEVIGKQAFHRCRKLYNIHISNSVTTIEDYAFDGCVSLRSFFVSAHISNIGIGILAGCKNIYQIEVDKRNTIYDSRDIIETFISSGDEIRYNSNAIFHTQSNALIAGCQNTMIPYGITSIEDGAFIDCTTLENISLPDSIINVDELAFKGCTGLMNIYIPALYKAKEKFSRLLSIEKNSKILKLKADRYLLGIDCKTEINKDHDLECIESWYDDYGVEYSFDKKHLLRIPKGIKEYSIIEGTEVIEDKAFLHSDLEVLYIPQSVTDIKTQSYLGRPNLSKIVVNDNNPVYDSRDNCNAVIKTDTNTLLYGCKNTIIPQDIKIIGDYAFYYCSSLKSIIIPGGVQRIECFAFEGCDDLTKIELPDTVISIGQEAFARCEKLNSVIMPNGLKEVGTLQEDGELIDIFYDCEELQSIIIPKNTLQDYLKVIPNHEDAFKYKDDL